MSVHSLLGPSNSESFPEVDLVSTVRMAWLPPQVKYWISNLDARDKKKKEIKILPLLPLLLPFFLPSLRVVISEQLAVRIEQDTVMTLAEGDPNRQVGGLQAGAGLFARFSVALVHQKSYLAPCQDSPLRHSLGDCGGNKNRGWRRGASNLRMCLHPQRATPRCEGGGKHGLSTRRPPRLWSPPLDSRSTSSPLDFPGQFSLWGKLLIITGEGVEEGFCLWRITWRDLWRVQRCTAAAQHLDYPRLETVGWIVIVLYSRNTIRLVNLPSTSIA